MAKAAKKVVKSSVPVVTQSEVAIVEKVRAEAKKLSDQLKALNKVIEASEAGIMAKLVAGGEVESGDYVAVLDKSPGRVSVSWKSEAIELAVAAGQNAGVYEALVKAKNPPQMVTSLLITKVVA